MIRHGLLLLILVVSASDLSAQQTFTFSMLPVTALPGSSGNTNLDVFLTYTGPGTSSAIGGFQFRATATAAPGVTFTGLSEGTPASNYLFGTNGFGITASLPGGGSAFPGSVTDFIGNDLAATAGVTMTNGQTLRIGQITYDLSPSVVNGTPIPINFFIGDTFLSNEVGDPLGSYTFSSGSITPVPEPISAGFAIAMFLAFLGRSSRSGRRIIHTPNH
jgi:hypothetical protein